MKFSATFPAAVLLASGCLFWAGCFPPSRGQTAEEKESHFIAGKNRLNAMDYASAIKSFEKALEVNPRSAAAHFELGCLFLDREKDPAAAIYHFQKYLQLSPGAHDAEVIKTHIMGCKQELARQVSLGPISESQQRDLQKMLEENKRLLVETNRLTQEVTLLRQFIQANRPAATLAASQSRAGVDTRGGVYSPTVASGSNVAPPAGGQRRPYIIREGDTLAGIARKNGIKLTALQAANSGLDPKRMRPGQTIYLPD